MKENETKQNTLSSASPSHLFSRVDRWIRPLTSAAYQLGNLLEVLGVEVTEERLREAFTELDRGGDGIDEALSLDDFEAWWASNQAAK